MAGEEEAGGAGGLRGEAEAAGGEWGLDLHLRQGGDEGAALQPFLQGPGGVLGRPRLDNEKARGVETGRHETGAVRASPFAARGPRQAPQHDAAAICLCRLGDDGEGEAEGRRRVPVAVRPDLVEAALGEPPQGTLGVPIVIGGER